MNGLDSNGSRRCLKESVLEIQILGLEATELLGLKPKDIPPGETVGSRPSMAGSENHTAIHVLATISISSCHGPRPLSWPPVK